MCIDWSCGKQSCNLQDNITNTFHYNLCKDCAAIRSRKTCRTCINGRKINNTYYHCRKDNTVVNISP